MAKYYIINFSCGCSTTSSFSIALGAGRWCEEHKKFVTVTSCEEYTTMRLYQGE